MPTTEPIVRHIVGTPSRWLCGDYRTSQWPRMLVAPPDSVLCEKCLTMHEMLRERRRQKQIDRSVHKCPDCRCGR